MRLIIPSIEYEMKFMEMIKDYRDNNEKKYNSDYYTKGFDFAQHLKGKENLSKGIDLQEGYVPTSEYWLVNIEGDIIGTARLRHYLSSRYINEGGHIGYDIAPRYRRQGYGSRILQMMLGKAEEMGLKKVLLTCYADNIGSRKIIEGNGGKYENQIISEDSGKLVNRYWIDI